MLEPAHPLVGTSVGKGVRDHVTLCLSLDPIIPNSAGGVQPFFDVSSLQDPTALVGLIGLNPGQTGSLQFHPHG